MQNLLTHAALAAALPRTDLVTLANLVAEQIGDDPEARLATLSDDDRPPVSAMLAIHRRALAGEEVGLAEFFSEVRAHTSSWDSSESPGRRRGRLGRWTRQAEESLNHENYFTADQYHRHSLGRKGAFGDLISLGHWVSSYCKAHGLEPKRLQKRNHRLTYWPVEALKQWTQVLGGGGQ